MHERDDQHEMTTKMLHGDTDALRRLMEREKPAMLRAAAGWTRGDVATAEELVQIAFIRAWERRHQLNDVSKLQGWLYAILHNVFRDWTRRKDRREVTTDDVIERIERGVAGEASDPATDLVNKEQFAALHLALRTLSPTDAQILALRYGSELTVDSIAAALSLRPNTVKSRIRRALNKLGKQFPDMQE